jgi:lipid-A-disaccharide synthase
LKVLISAGEVSGDIVGALLARKLREVEPRAEIFGVGGARMAAAGVEIDAHTNHLGTVGVTEAVRAIPAFARVLLAIRKRVRTAAPDVAIHIGNDVFNVLLARWLRTRGVTTISYFPPQVWIWRAVAPLIARSYDTILTSFPLEHEVYGRAGARTGTTVSFVGHYLCETLTPRTSEEMALSRQRLGLAGASRVVGLLPGSRPHEVRRLMGILLVAARELSQSDSRLRFVVPVADSSYRAEIQNDPRRRDLGERVIIVSDSHEAMRSADVVLLASGTASLEAALLGVPMVVVYKVSAITAGVMRGVIRLGLIKSETVGLPNLILGHEVVPELRQSRATAAAVVREARALLDDELKRHAMRAALLEVAGKVAAGPTLERVVETVVALAAPQGSTDAASLNTARAHRGARMPGITEGRS